ncbi:hypothetical protein ANN_24871 [Periplaneta americana]|uniref:Reverse transcriptase domain-containing protein n=1 Tax=Periplaneta americana TaxID=6978 RepID=A0ABQ8RZV6_PERAM|nr:hypothetical protein ANN_24871 [Periplaneta americana]
MSPGSSTESYPAFAHIGLRENPEKPQPGNLPRPGIKPGPSGFAARRANRYSTESSDEVEKELDVNSVWENIRDSIKIAAEQSIGYYETKKKKPWFDEDCCMVVERRKQAKLKFLQDPVEEKRDNYFNERREASRILRNKKRGYLKEKLNEVETNSKNKNIRDLYKGIKEFKNGYQPRLNVIKDENGDLLADSPSILNRWKNYFAQLLNVHRPNRNDRDEIEIQTAEPFIPEPTLSEVEIAIENLKKYKSPGIDQIPAELIQEGGSALCSEIYKLVLAIWEKEIVPEQWKESIIVPIFKKGDKTNCVKVAGYTVKNKKIFYILTFPLPFGPYLMVLIFPFRYPLNQIYCHLDPEALKLNLQWIILMNQAILVMIDVLIKALLAEEETLLRDMLQELNDSCEQYGMKINANKTKIMVITRKINKSLMLNEFQSLGRAIVKEDEYEEVRWDGIVSIVSWRERVFRLWWEESVDGIGDSEMVFGETRPRIHHRSPGIHLTVGEKLIIRGAIAHEGPRPTSRLLASRPHAESEVDDHPTRMEVSSG